MNDVALIDNYDSFTYNLVHALEALGAHVTVMRNDEFDIDHLQPFTNLVLSPGPGLPDEANLLKEVIRTYAGKKRILGVCLGHQAIAEVFGATLVNLGTVHHGVSQPAKIVVSDETLFQDVSSTFDVGRYHSWTVSPDAFPSALEVTATDLDGNIIALRHRAMDIKGVQFHPESILTPMGRTILRNWLENR